MLFTICLVQRSSRWTKDFLRLPAVSVYYVSALHTSAIFPQRRSSIFVPRHRSYVQPNGLNVHERVCIPDWTLERDVLVSVQLTCSFANLINLPGGGYWKTRLKAERKESRFAPSRPGPWWFNPCSAHFLSLDICSFFSGLMESHSAQALHCSLRFWQQFPPLTIACYLTFALRTEIYFSLVFGAVFWCGRVQKIIFIASLLLFKQNILKVKNGAFLVLSKIGSNSVLYSIKRMKRVKNIKQALFSAKGIFFFSGTSLLPFPESSVKILQTTASKNSRHQYKQPHLHSSFWMKSKATHSRSSEKISSASVISKTRAACNLRCKWS